MLYVINDDYMIYILFKYCPINKRISGKIKTKFTLVNINEVYINLKLQYFYCNSVLSSSVAWANKDCRTGELLGAKKIKHAIHRVKELLLTVETTKI